MKFDPTNQIFSSNRYPITAKNGIVASSNALCSQVGLDILKRGGNAVDAAVATAAALTVIEPMSNGIGSDAFAIVWFKEKIYGLNSTGYTPKNIDVEKIKNENKQMPKYGWIPVTVPGAPKAWAALISRFGNLSLDEVLKPAIIYAKEGYSVPPLQSVLYKMETENMSKDIKGDSRFDEWFRIFTKNGKSYEFGDLIYLKDHARTLELIGKTDAEAFYKGEIAQKLVEQSERDGGYFSKEDLEDFDVEWVDPISVNYRGYDVWEIPPNGQGVVALMALNILKEDRFEDLGNIDEYHRKFEAMKIAFSDGKKYITDKNFMKVDVKDMISPEYGRHRAEEIGMTAKDYEAYNFSKGGTVYLSTADSQGNMVSFIQSNYMGFGSGIVLEGYGVSLQNRGADFSLDKTHYNYLQPRKKTYHTIIPGFITKDSKPIGPFGVMGAYMQPQGHVQVVSNMIDFNLNPQMALDRPRWQWIEGRKILVEPKFDRSVVEKLRRLGHEISFSENHIDFGRGQIIIRLDNGIYVAGTESRCDSNIACY